MPELPEVEVVRRGLEKQLLGKTVKKVEVYHPRLLRGQNISEFTASLENWQINLVARRGKFIWFTGSKTTPEPAGKEPAVLLHLGMSGQTLVNSDTLKLDQKTQKHLRVSWFLDQNLRVDFVDQRMFGRLHLTKLVAAGSRQVPQELVGKVAPDVLEKDFHSQQIYPKISSSRRNIKTLLLDQAIASGIGNIYADEALYAAQINPHTPGKLLKESQVSALYQAAAAVMEKALAQGGTSFDALYVDTEGNPGYFARSLGAYGRSGQACIRCSTRMVSEKISGRSSTYCPHCQPLPPELDS